MVDNSAQNAQEAEQLRLKWEAWAGRTHVLPWPWTPPYGQKEEHAMFKTNLAGAQVVQTVGPFRQVLTSEGEKTAEGTQQRFLLVTPAETDAAELVEKTP